jgi:hypothetical protein
MRTEDPLASQPFLERALADEEVRELVSCTVRRAVRLDESACQHAEPQGT